MNGPQRTAVSHEELWHKQRQKEFLHSQKKIMKPFAHTVKKMSYFSNPAVNRKRRIRHGSTDGTTITRSCSRKAVNSLCETIKSHLLPTGQELKYRNGPACMSVCLSVCMYIMDSQIVLLGVLFWYPFFWVKDAGAWVPNTIPRHDE